ncbi:MAG: hypothetical protein RLW87_14105 [Alphaproteobacteria bacterium]|jgi:hypothetical protein|uniref:hypothetical protein n=1 Tax=Pacificispira sp. TaxID=2888761 RepID=UPI0032FE0E83
MERDMLYFGLIAGGSVLLWLAFRRGLPSRGRMSLIACGIAVGIAYLLLFKLMG